MFLRWILEDIWAKGNFSVSGILTEDGRLHSGLKDDVEKILSVEEVFSECKSRLNEAGYRVKRTAPWKANAMIRVFREEGWHHEDSVHWIYGADIYLRNLGIYINRERVMLDHGIYYLRWIFFPDDMPISTPEFVDYYVRISQV